MSYRLLGAIAGSFLLVLMSRVSYADELQLVNRKEGNKVEVLEEHQDAFIVKIPKNEIKMIKRETPTEIKLWKEKKILWEDQGDYLLISLPKERIRPASLATEGSSHESPEYETVTSLAAGLAETGEKSQGAGLSLLTGSVAGRVLSKDGTPLVNCHVKLTPIRGPINEVTKFLTGKSATKLAQRPVATTTGSDGTYLFEEMPIGDYDISWSLQGSKHWLGRLSDRPDVTVRAGEIAQQGDIKI